MELTAFDTTPDRSEYDEYYIRYIDLVPSGNILITLRNQFEETHKFLTMLDPNLRPYRYETGKWSIAEVVGHIMETERVFGQRAWRYTRDDEINLPGFDHDKYIENSRYDEYAWEDLLAEWRHIREGNLMMFKHFTESDLMKSGISNGAKMTARSILHLVVGHATHHLNIIKNFYLK